MWWNWKHAEVQNININANWQFNAIRQWRLYLATIISRITYLLLKTMNLLSWLLSNGHYFIPAAYCTIRSLGGQQFQLYNRLQSNWTLNKLVQVEYKRDNKREKNSCSQNELWLRLNISLICELFFCEINQWTGKIHGKEKRVKR